MTDERPGHNPKYNHERIVRVRNMDFKANTYICQHILQKNNFI